MILNNLDHRVAQFPHELVTYGGNGQVFSNWAQVLDSFCKKICKIWKFVKNFSLIDFKLKLLNVMASLYFKLYFIIDHHSVLVGLELSLNNERRTDSCSLFRSSTRSISKFQKSTKTRHHQRNGWSHFLWTFSFHFNLFEQFIEQSVTCLISYFIII